MRYIKVSFILSSKNVLMDVLSDSIRINPSYVKTVFPANSIAEPYWFVEVSSSSPCIEEPLAKLEALIKPRSEAILNACDTYKITPTVLVSIAANYENRPEITISPKMLQFISSFDAELTFEIVGSIWE